MDGDRFDALSRLLGKGVNRRAALAALAALAVGGVGEAAAKQHKNKNKNKHHKAKPPGAGCSEADQPCDANTKCCGGQSGKLTCVDGFCKQPLQGPPPGAPGKCVPNNGCAHFCDAVYGDTQAAGKCTSDGARCVAKALCNDANCQSGGALDPSKVCCTPTASGTCDPTKTVACCTSDQVCSNHQCCPPDDAAITCKNKCGQVTNNCGQTIDCNSFCTTGCCDAADPAKDSGTCQPGTANGACGADGGACKDCGATGYECSDKGTCVCPSPRDECNGVCCTSSQVCDTSANACVACDVCASGCTYTDVQSAVDNTASGTIRICAGTFLTNATIPANRNLTLDGAGASKTILDGGNTNRVLQIAAGATVTVQDLTVTKGKFFDSSPTAIGGCPNLPAGDPTGWGGGIRNQGDLTLVGVTVTENEVPIRNTGSSPYCFGGGIANQGKLTLGAGTVVSRNKAQDGGGVVNGGTGASTATTGLQSGSLVGGTALWNGTAAGGGNGNWAYHDAGGVLVFNGTASMATGSSVKFNTAATANGGGIYINGPATWVTLADNTIVTCNDAPNSTTTDNCSPSTIVNCAQVGTQTCMASAASRKRRKQRRK